MNILLKYFIYFLLGIIIYYCLFNSPNVGSKKLIEGFGTEITNRSKIIYLKSRYKLNAGTDGAQNNLEENDNDNDDAPIYLINTGDTVINANLVLSESNVGIREGENLQLSRFTLDLNESKFIQPPALDAIITVAERMSSDNFNYNELTSTDLVEIANDSSASINVALNIDDYPRTINIRYDYVSPGADTDDLDGDEYSILTEAAPQSYTIVDDSESTDSILSGTTGFDSNNTLVYQQDFISSDEVSVEPSEWVSNSNKFIINIPSRILQISSGDSGGSDTSIDQTNLTEENIVIKFINNDSTFSDRISTNHGGVNNFERILSDLGELQNRIYSTEFGGIAKKIFKFRHTVTTLGAAAQDFALEIDMNMTSIRETATLTYTPSNSPTIFMNEPVHFVEYVQIYRDIVPIDSLGSVDDIDNSILLLARVMGTDESGSFGGENIGCNETICAHENNRLRSEGVYNVTYTIKDADNQNDHYHQCSPALPNTAEYTAGTNLKCSPDICCVDTSCSSRYFGRGQTCGNRSIIPAGQCVDDNCDSCCGEPISGVIRTMFYSIIQFRNTISGDPNPNVTRNRNKLLLKDIIYFIYNNMLNLNAMLSSGGILDDGAAIPSMIDAAGDHIPDAHTYTNYEKLTNFFESAFDINVGTGQYTLSENYDSVMGSMVINPNIANINGDTISQFITRITSHAPLGGGHESLIVVGNKFQHFLSNYFTTETDNNDALILDLKSAIALMTIPSPNLHDGGTGSSFSEPISLLTFGARDWKTRTIALSDFQLYL